MKKILILLLSVFSLFLFAQENGAFEKILECSLFQDQGDNPLLINRGDHWYPLGLADFSEPRRLASFNTEEHRYRIRFRVTVKSAADTAQSALQIRLNQNNVNSQYHITFEESHYLEKTFHSNWYLTQEGFLNSAWRGPVNLRMLTPPGNPSNIEILEVVLELWAENINQDEERVMMANQGSFLLLSDQSEEDTSRLPLNWNLTYQDAEDFALSFIESQINGDLPSFYAALSKDVYSLDTGNLYSCYRIPPPYPWHGYTLLDFKADFQYQLYDYDQFIELFPQWAEPQRHWNPHENNYLFIAYPINQDFSQPENAIMAFMIGPGHRGPQVIGRPQF